jgi:hypothetical protein
MALSELADSVGSKMKFWPMRNENPVNTDLCEVAEQIAIMLAERSAAMGNRRYEFRNAKS